MKIHAIHTGTVAVTSAWRDGIGHGRRGQVHAIADRDWTDRFRVRRGESDRLPVAHDPETGVRRAQRERLHPSPAEVAA